MFIACIQIDRPFAELRCRREGESYEKDAHETQAHIHTMETQTQNT